MLCRRSLHIASNPLRATLAITLLALNLLVLIPMIRAQISTQSGGTAKTSISGERLTTFYVNDEALRFTHETLFGWYDEELKYELYLPGPMLETGVERAGTNATGVEYSILPSAVLDLPQFDEWAAEQVKVQFWYGVVSSAGSEVAMAGLFIHDEDDDLTKVIVLAGMRNQARGIELAGLMLAEHRTWSCPGADAQSDLDIQAAQSAYNNCMHSINVDHALKFGGCSGGAVISCTLCIVPVFAPISCPTCVAAIGCAAYQAADWIGDGNAAANELYRMADCACLGAQARSKGLTPPACGTFKCPN